MYLSDVMLWDPELFDFQIFRFSFGETTEEAFRKRKSKRYGPVSCLIPFYALGG